MSQSIKIVVLLGLVAVSAACARRSEPVMTTMQPAPIVAEPVTTKY